MSKANFPAGATQSNLSSLLPQSALSRNTQLYQNKNTNRTCPLGMQVMPWLVDCAVPLKHDGFHDLPSGAEGLNSFLLSRQVSVQAGRAAHTQPDCRGRVIG